MSKKFFFPIICASVLSAAATVPTVKWQLLSPEEIAEPADGSKKPACVERITVTGLDSIAKLCFNQFARPMQMASPGDTLTEVVAGYYYITSPKFGTPAPEAVFDIVVGYPVRTFAERPESFHFVTPGGRVVPVADEGVYLADAALRDPKWMARLTTADSLYRRNLELVQGKKPGPFDIVPSFKKVTPSKGSFKAGAPVETRLVKNDNPEFYRITLTPEKALIEGASQRAITMAGRTLSRRLLEPNGGVLPCAVIEDWPDFPYRAVMLDIARNYQSPENMKRYADILADYRFNTLHFHLIDDEAWRLEIPGLPELTDVGARRGYTLDSSDFLPQIYCGNGDPDSKEGTANGYFSRRDFIDFLKYCDALGIAVIPEVESPGHARAAIKAMEARYRRTGDDTYRLIEPGDTSRYTTAQLLHDNLMNPAMPGPYRFMEKVFSEIAAMYEEAGVQLPGIHIGGDEVPKGAWDGSPAAQKMEKDLGISGKHEMHGEFVRKAAQILKGLDIPVYGWQDITTGYSDDYNREVAPTVGGTNCWVSSYDPEKNVAILGVRNGYPVILSNVDYFYMDMIYEWNPEEEGLYWGRPVDEFISLSGYPDTLCPPQGDTPGKVIGVSGQLFSETVRTPQQVERMLLPKMFGLAERGWNGQPTFTDADFNVLIGEKELPRLQRAGYDWHLRQPGIMVDNGLIYMNSPYGDAEIRFTLDGSRPDFGSELYTAPVALPANADAVRAILVKDGKKSVVTVLPLAK